MSIRSGYSLLLVMFFFLMVHFFGLMVLFSTSSNIHAGVTVILLHFATKHCVVIGS